MSQRFGLHASTAGALENAADEAVSFGADTFQIFSSSPRMWRGATPAKASVEALRRSRAEHGLHPLVIHGNYLINLASRDSGIRHKSIQAFRGEITRAMVIGADHLVFHPGSYKDQTIEEAIAAVSDGLAEAAAGLAGPLTLLIENTAGQGSALGSKLGELAGIRALTAPRVDFEIGYCIDTCHSFAAGFDLESRAFFEAVEEALGWARIPVLHANDSKGARGSRLDRHEHIGHGQIGEAGFSFLLTQPELRDKAFILELPAENALADLATLRRCASVD